MEVEDRLPRAGTVVHDHPVGVGMSGGGGHPPRHGEEVTSEALVLEVRQTRHVRPRDHQHMERGLGVEVAERDGPRIVVHERRGQLTRRDAAEHALAHAW